LSLGMGQRRGGGAAAAAAAGALCGLVELAGFAAAAAAGGGGSWRCVPRHLRLAVAPEPGAMRVSWTAPSAECSFEVEYWRTDGAGPRGRVDEAAAGETYGPRDLCGPSQATDPANFRDPGFFFHAEMVTLDPATNYNYSVTGYPAGLDARSGRGLGAGLRSGEKIDAEASSSALSWFRSAPAVGAPFSMVTFMDVGEPFDAEPHSPGGFVVTSAATQDVLAGAPAPVSAPEYAAQPASALPYSLVLHSGDLSYARGEGEVWERWMDMIEPLSSHAPYMISMGNHECLWAGPSSSEGGWGPAPDFRPVWGQYGNDSGGECCVPAAKRFSAMPGGVLGRTPSPLYQPVPGVETPPGADGGNPPYWYSFDYGAAHFVIFSTEHDFTPGSEQLSWLERDLSRVDRTKTPWVIGSAHRPAYTSFVHLDLQPVSLALALTLEPLLAKYEVNLMLYGHVHTYERTCPLRDGECVGSAMGGGGRNVKLQGGTVHVTIGCGGHSLNIGVPTIKSGWSEVVHVDFGYGRLEVLNASHAAWEFVRVERGAEQPPPSPTRAPEVLDRTFFQRLP